MSEIALDWSKLITAQDKAEAEKEAQQNAARALLSQTDWYVIRKVETGEAIPPEISEARAQARAAL